MKQFFRVIFTSFIIFLCIYACFSAVMTKSIIGEYRKEYLKIECAKARLSGMHMEKPFTDICETRYWSGKL